MDIYTFSIDSNGNHCLEHHGVKGQKWGVLDKSVYVPVGSRRQRVFDAPSGKAPTKTKNTDDAQS